MNNNIYNLKEQRILTYNAVAGHGKTTLINSLIVEIIKEFNTNNRNNIYNCYFLSYTNKNTVDNINDYNTYTETNTNNLMYELEIQTIDKFINKFSLKEELNTESYAEDIHYGNFLNFIKGKENFEKTEKNVVLDDLFEEIISNNDDLIKHIKKMKNIDILVIDEYQDTSIEKIIYIYLMFLLGKIRFILNIGDINQIQYTGKAVIVYHDNNIEFNDNKIKLNTLLLFLIKKFKLKNIDVQEIETNIFCEMKYELNTRRFSNILINKIKSEIQKNSNISNLNNNFINKTKSLKEDNKSEDFQILNINSLDIQKIEFNDVDMIIGKGNLFLKKKNTKMFLSENIDFIYQKTKEKKIFTFFHPKLLNEIKGIVNSILKNIEYNGKNYLEVIIFENEDEDIEKICNFQDFKLFIEYLTKKKDIRNVIKKEYEIFYLFSLFSFIYLNKFKEEILLMDKKNNHIKEDVISSIEKLEDFIDIDNELKIEKNYKIFKQINLNTFEDFIHFYNMNYSYEDYKLILGEGYIQWQTVYKAKGITIKNKYIILYNQKLRGKWSINKERLYVALTRSQIGGYLILTGKDK